MSRTLFTLDEKVEKIEFRYWEKRSKFNPDISKKVSSWSLDLNKFGKQMQLPKSGRIIITENWERSCIHLRVMIIGYNIEFQNIPHWKNNPKLEIWYPRLFPRQNSSFNPSWTGGNSQVVEGHKDCLKAAILTAKEQVVKESPFKPDSERWDKDEWMHDTWEQNIVGKSFISVGKVRDYYETCLPEETNQIQSIKEQTNVMACEACGCSPCDCNWGY